MFFQCVFTPVANGAVVYVPPSGEKSALLKAEYHPAGFSLPFFEFKVEILVN